MVDETKNNPGADEHEKNKKHKAKDYSLEEEKEKTKTAIEDEDTGKVTLTGIVQQTQLTRKGPRGRKVVIAGGKTEFSKRDEGKSAQQGMASNNKKRAGYASN